MKEMYLEPSSNKEESQVFVREGVIETGIEIRQYYRYTTFFVRRQ